MQPQSPPSKSPTVINRPPIGDGGAPAPTPKNGKSKWDDYRNIDMDLHQVLTKAKRSPEVSEPNPEMIDLAKAWLADDPRNKLVVSCGGFRDYGKSYQDVVSRWLAKQGIDIKRVSYEYKPRVLAVIDDHGLEYVEGNGKKMLAEVLNRSRNLDEFGPDVVGNSGRPVSNEQKTLPPETRQTALDTGRGQSLRK